MRQVASGRDGLSGVLLALALIVLNSASARGEGKPLPDDRLGKRTAPILLLSRPEVRADLELTPTQGLEAEEAISRLYVRAASLRGKTGPAAVAGRKLIDQEQIQWIDAMLSEKQRERLLQIDLQWEGTSALVSRPILAETLHLSIEQKNLLAMAIKNRNESLKAKPGSVRTAEAELTREALTVLDEGQRGTWKAMLGHPLPFHLATEPPSTVTK